MDKETIEAISSLWPYGVLIFLAIFWIIYRKPIRKFIENLYMIKFKRGGTEIEVQKQETEIAPQKIERQTSENPEVKDAKPQTLADAVLKYGEGKFEEGDKIIDEIKSDVQTEDDKTRNILLKHYYRFKYGDTDAQREIEKLIERSTLPKEVNSTAHLLLAYSLIDGLKFESAINELLTALKFTGIDSSKVNIISRLSDIYYRNNQKNKALDVILEHLPQMQENSSKSNLWKAIGEFYSKENLKNYKAFAYDKALEFMPNDTSLLFDTAYAYGESAFASIGANHYISLIKISPDNYSAFNNLGVVFHKYNLKFNFMKYFKKSLEGGNTVAAANYADKLIDVGLYDEAKLILDNARVEKEVHPNVWNSFTKLEAEQKKEENSKDSLTKNAVEQQIFVRQYIDKINRKSELPDLKGKWKLNNQGTIQINQSDTIITSDWDWKVHYKISLSIKNMVAYGTYTEPGLFIINSPVNLSAYALISDDFNTITIMILRETECSFISLIRQ